jgi:ATP-GRASP peptide maturase of grasp-with-spasm system
MDCEKRIEFDMLPVLIFCEKDDATIDIIIDYLISLQIPFYRINSGDDVFFCHYDFCDGRVVIMHDGNTLEISNETRVLIRRARLNFKMSGAAPPSGLEYSLLFVENRKIEEHISRYISKISKFGSFVFTLNKLDVLSHASDVGLTIPNTRILKNFKCVEKFNKDIDSGLIMKAISEGFVRDKDNEINYLTRYVEMKEVRRIKSFFPTLFQECIDKIGDLRIFYFDNQFFSSLILSQNNHKTKVDFRDYDYEKPNRVLRFKLPEEIEDKLQRLMNRLNLDTGSIDMVLDNNMRYVFLEVNPEGQFDQVSRPCGYYIENKIARLFVNHERN